MKTSVAAFLLAAAALAAPAAAQQQAPARYDIAFNRFYDYEEITAHLHGLVEAYPELLSIQSLGESEQGRAMWLVILNRAETGPHESKPAIWIDGNVHGNEIQAAETVLYSLWYLAKSDGQVEALTELIDRTAFYFLPMQNPDGRAYWFDEPNTSSSSRTGQRPTDNDYDGQLDEDPPNDLDGDGHIGTMWRFDPTGSWRRNRDDPRIIERVPAGEVGELSRVGSEGIDDDGDGRINEDGPGGYDMNRNWGADWQPNHIQFGAGEHPFSYPETRCIASFIAAHPNIAAAQSYHNAGGMILRGPGASYDADLYSGPDRAVYDALGRAGEEMLPFYRYMILHADLYTVHGGFVNWMAEGLGIVSFTNELWTARRIRPDGDQPQRGFFGSGAAQEEQMRWQDRVLFGQTFTDWTEHDHPTLGRVLIGGSTKYGSRTPPHFLLEEECHRNFAFTMHHAAEMPELSFDLLEAKPAGDGLWQVTVEVRNERIIPTRMDIAQRRRIGRPDLLTLAGDSATIVTAGRAADRFAPTITPVEHRLERIEVPEGIPSRGRRTFRYLVAAPAGTVLQVAYSAEKARDIAATITLE